MPSEPPRSSLRDQQRLILKSLRPSVGKGHCTRGLGRGRIHEALNCALPPALCDLNLAEVTRGQARNHSTPEDSRGDVGSRDVSVSQESLGALRN
jgi:hypothetical protein